MATIRFSGVPSTSTEKGRGGRKDQDEGGECKPLGQVRRGCFLEGEQGVFVTQERKRTIIVSMRVRGV